MDALAEIKQSFLTVEADVAVKNQALQFLER